MGGCQSSANFGGQTAEEFWEREHVNYQQQEEKEERRRLRAARRGKRAPAPRPDPLLKQSGDITGGAVDQPSVPSATLVVQSTRSSDGGEANSSLLNESNSGLNVSGTGAVVSLSPPQRPRRYDSKKAAADVSLGEEIVQAPHVDSTVVHAAPPRSSTSSSLSGGWVASPAVLAALAAGPDATPTRSGSYSVDATTSSTHQPAKPFWHHAHSASTSACASTTASAFMSSAAAGDVGSLLSPRPMIATSLPVSRRESPREKARKTVVATVEPAATLTVAASVPASVNDKMTAMAVDTQVIVSSTTHAAAVAEVFPAVLPTLSAVTASLSNPPSPPSLPSLKAPSGVRHSSSSSSGSPDERSSPGLVRMSPRHDEQLLDEFGRRRTASLAAQMLASMSPSLQPIAASACDDHMAPLPHLLPDGPHDDDLPPPRSPKQQSSRRHNPTLLPDVDDSILAPRSSSPSLTLPLSPRSHEALSMDAAQADLYQRGLAASEKRRQASAARRAQRSMQSTSASALAPASGHVRLPSLMQSIAPRPSSALGAVRPLSPSAAASAAGITTAAPLSFRQRTRDTHSFDSFVADPARPPRGAVSPQRYHDASIIQPRVGGRTVVSRTPRLSSAALRREQEAGRIAVAAAAEAAMLPAAFVRVSSAERRSLAAAAAASVASA